MTTTWTVTIEGAFQAHPWLDPGVDLASVVTSRASTFGVDPYTRTDSDGTAAVVHHHRQSWAVTEAWIRTGAGTICTLSVDVAEVAGSLALACTILADAVERLGVVAIDAATFSRDGGERRRAIWTPPDSLWTEIAAPGDATPALLSISTGGGPRSSHHAAWADASSGVAWLAGSRWEGVDGQDDGTDGVEPERALRVVVPEWSLSVLAFVADVVTAAWPTCHLRVSRDAVTQ